MKKIFATMMMAVLALAITACSNDDFEPAEASKPLIVGNMHGTWRMENWNGNEGQDDWYFYISINRDDKSFVSYDNLGSMYGKKRTGTLDFVKGATYNSATLLVGTYAYGQGEWKHDYHVQIFQDRMVWTAADDASDVITLVRVSEIPADILAGSRSVAAE